MQLPWRDRRGRLLPLKAVLLPLCFVPGLVVAGQWLAGDLGAMPINAAIREAGLWTVRFLLITLAVTPLRTVFNWPQLLLTRRMLGITALGYALTHLALFIVDQKFALLVVISEILKRFYLTVGFIALLGLLALGATSTDAVVRRMGCWWKRLHRLSYPIGVLAMLHFFIQAKADVAQPTYAVGIFMWLMIWRLLPNPIQVHRVALFGLAVLATAATIALEFSWYSLATRINASRVLEANLTIAYGLRPAHWVLVTGLALALAAAGARIAPQPRLVQTQTG